MKSKALACILILSLLVYAMTACRGAAVEEDNDKLQVVTTIFPLYDWIREITAGSEAVEVTLLVDNGMDYHSYQPGADDIIRISTCDIFVYIGGESDEWAKDVLANAKNPGTAVVNAMDVLGSAVKTEEIIEGMTESEHVHGEETEEPEEYDEHVWLSLKNAAVICDAIAKVLTEADSANSGIYQKNVQEYTERLAALDREYLAAAEASKTKTLVFCDRFPFRYLTDDYGFTYYAAFPGCSAETEAGFSTIRFLTEKLDELGLKAVLTIEGSDKSLAETVIANSKDTGREILVLDSMQNVSIRNEEKVTCYTEIMEKNLEVLKQALQ